MAIGGRQQVQHFHAIFRRVLRGSNQIIVDFKRKQGLLHVEKDPFQHSNRDIGRVHRLNTRIIPLQSIFSFALSYHRDLIQIFVSFVLRRADSERALLFIALQFDQLLRQQDKHARNLLPIPRRQRIRRFRLRRSHRGKRSMQIIQDLVVQRKRKLLLDHRFRGLHALAEFGGASRTIFSVDGVFCVAQKGRKVDSNPLNEMAEEELEALSLLMGEKTERHDLVQVVVLAFQC